MSIGAAPLMPPSPVLVDVAFAACMLILGLAAGFHFYWGFGGRLGRSVALPQTEDGRPIADMPAYAAHAVGVLLVAAMALVLAFERTLHVPLPTSWLRVGMLLLSAGFGLRALSWHTYVGLFKKVRTTEFARYDTWLYSPLCLCVCIGALVLMVADTDSAPR